MTTTDNASLKAESDVGGGGYILQHSARSAFCWRKHTKELRENFNFAANKEYEEFAMELYISLIHQLHGVLNHKLWFDCFIKCVGGGCGCVAGIE